MHLSSPYIPSFSLSKFSETITAPYTSLAAFSSGVIDADGNLLKPESSIDPYEYFIIKLKKIFDQLPMSYTKARLASYVSTFQMFNEEAEFFGLNANEFLFFIEGYLESGLLINEDMGTGMISGGGAPGTLGTPQTVQNSGAVMGYDKPLNAPMFTRMPVEMFDVDDAEFKNFKNAKAWKHIPDSETKRYLKRFQQRNPSGKMAIRSNKDIHWLSYPSKSFVEEYDLGFLDILKEEREFGSSPSLRVSATVHKPTDEELLKHWEDNSQNFNLTGVPKGLTPEKHMIETAKKSLQAKGFKHITGLKSPSELKHNEFAFFNPGNGSDLVVGMPDTESSNGVHHSTVELKYKAPKSISSKTIEPQFILPNSTKIDVNKKQAERVIKALGINGDTILDPHETDTEQGTIDVGKVLRDLPSLSGGATNKALYQKGNSSSRTQLIPGTSQGSRRYNLLRGLANHLLPQVMQSKGDHISLVGNNQGLAVLHHSNPGSNEHSKASELLDILGLKPTHRFEELKNARAPYYGSNIRK